MFPLAGWLFRELTREQISNRARVWVRGIWEPWNTLE